MNAINFSPLQRYANHVFSNDNVWNKEKYLQSQTYRGETGGYASTFTFQYCHGNSFCEGVIGNKSIMIYGSHLQGYQIWVAELTELIDIVNGLKYPIKIHPQDKDGFIKAILKAVAA